MSFEGSRAVLVKDLSGNVATVSTSGINVKIIGGTTSISGSVIDASGRMAVTNSGTYMVVTDATTTNTAQVRLPADNMIPSSGVGLITHSILMARDSTTSVWHTLKGTEANGPASQNGLRMRLYVDSTQAGSNPKTGTFTPATADSGGVALAVSGVTIHGIRIKVISGVVAGGNIHIGSSGNPPYVSGGYQLGYGESIELKAYNPVFIRVWGSTSGIPVSWLGLDF